jgi:hypothetical protein
LLTNEAPESITLRDGTTQSLGPSAGGTFTIFESPCLQGNCEHPQFLQVEYLRKRLLYNELCERTDKAS